MGSPGPASLGRSFVGESSALSRLESAYSSHSRRLMSIPAPAIADYVCDGMLRSPEVVHHRHANALTPKMRGVNLGGWLLLQPWITPSLFYQFEDQPPDRTAMDMYNFCRVLGPIEGNRQLREHWTAWVTERELERLVEQGINAIRVPVGDWMWEPYGPYIGCRARARPCTPGSDLGAWPLLPSRGAALFPVR